jgi:peptide-methionine (S)-S-oxide reductase
MMSLTNPDKSETAIFAGGCFWCTEAIFQQVKGVDRVRSGYTGGDMPNPAYNDVITGETGHAEAIKITFDPKVVSYEQLLTIFFETHDPTTLNRQGADVGTQYRSAVFYTNEGQKEKALHIIDRLNREIYKNKKVVTEIAPFSIFYEAEKYHHDYFLNNKSQPYCKFVIQPKVEKFNKLFEEHRK